MSFHNFSPEVQQLLINLEAQFQSNHQSHLTTLDIFFALLSSDQAHIRDILMTCGLNKSIIMEVLPQININSQLDDRIESGVYQGMSQATKSVIVLSAKVAASFGKPRVDLIDLFIALLQSEETDTIREALGFVGLSPKSLE